MILSTMTHKNTEFGRNITQNSIIWLTYYSVGILYKTFPFLIILSLKASFSFLSMSIYAIQMT